MSALAFLLFWSLVGVHAQYPYVSFMGVTLPNHSYVDLALVGTETSDPGNTVRCHTDLTTCCSALHGSHRGDWYLPNGDRLMLSSSGSDIYVSHGGLRVDVSRKNDAISPSGIYHCEIATTAVHDDNDLSVRETVYVGLYPTNRGDITIASSIQLNGGGPQFTLTCNSTGGPATTVTWTRDSVTVAEGTETVLNDPMTAQYTHTLTVTGLHLGLYTCTVVNNKPSSASANIRVQRTLPPSGVTAVQAGPTSITVSWSPSRDATSYRIDYDSSGGHSGSVTVSGGSTEEYTLTGLQNEDTYTVSITATSQHLHSESVPADMSIGLIPDTPSVSVNPPTPTSISLSWSVSNDSVVTGYAVMYEGRIVSGGCPFTGTESLTQVVLTTSYEIMGLEEDSSYLITVTASNLAGSSEGTATAMTLEAAPSAPPTSVNVSEVTSSSITVQWGPMDCIHRNGDITGYSVRYGEVGSAEGERTVDEMVSGDFSGGMYIISGLSQATEYTFEVAAETSVGRGPYSEAVITGTLHNVYLSLSGTVIPNRGYVVISDIGTAGDDTALLCITNRPPPPGSIYSGGDWFGPGGTRVTAGTAVPGLRRNRAPMVVRLYRNTATGPPAEGIHQCQIQDDTDTLQTVNVGLFNNGGGGISVSEVVTLTVDSDLNGASPQFTLTCISTVGPATTVTWTRDSVPAVGESVTVLDDPVTAHYTHTLTVTGPAVLGAEYTCTVANRISTDSASITLQVPSLELVTIESSTATSISLSWNASEEPGIESTGRVEWVRDASVGCSGDHEGNATITDGSTSYEIMGLEEDSSYIITVAASNVFGSSEEVLTAMTQEAVSSGPPTSVNATSTPTTITVKWGPVDCSNQNGNITGYSVLVGSYNESSISIDGDIREVSVSGLTPFSAYNISVAAVNNAGTGVYSDNTFILTKISQPESVTFDVVNATGVRVSWSGSLFFLTELRHTSNYTSTGTVRRQSERTLPPLASPGVTSADMVLENDLTLDDSKEEIEHSFILVYTTVRVTHRVAYSLSVRETREYGQVTRATFTFDKKYFQIQFGPIDFCLNWGIERSHYVEEQLQAQLVGIIQKQHNDFKNFTTKFLREGLFLCHGNPTKATYRSTLVNPFPTTNASQLVGIIQSWVSSGPSLIIDGLLVRVNAECPTCIDGLDTEECDYPSSWLDSEVSERIGQVISVCAVKQLGQDICNLTE